MGLRNRIRRLEARLETDPERCPECNGKIVIEEHREDGTVTYPSGLPCSACDNIRPDGVGVGKIVVLFPGDGLGSGQSLLKSRELNRGGNLPYRQSYRK